MEVQHLKNPKADYSNYSQVLKNKIKKKGWDRAMLATM